MIRNENIILERIEEIKNKVIPLISPMHNTYLGFKNFQSKFSDVFLTIYSDVLVKILYTKRLEIFFSDVETICLRLDRDWSISLTQSEYTSRSTEFHWDYAEGNSSDPLCINNSDTILVPISYVKYCVYNLITEEWEYEGMSFDNYDAMIMQLQTISTSEFYSTNVVQSMIDLVLELRLHVPTGYTLMFDNIYRYLTKDNINTISGELEIAAKTFSR